ncbi:MAG TPA: BatD family protein, partial [Polyangiaceae bacterium]
MNAPLRLAVTALLSLFGLALALPARAQVSLQAHPSASKVEVGQPFRVELSASAEGQDQPSNPRLPVPAGVSVNGPSVGTRTQVSLGMGGMRQSVSTTATWEVVASRVGTLRLGPPSVEAGGRRYTGNPIVVEVVPQGTLPPPPRRPSRFDPFGMFDPFGGSGFPPGFFGQDAPNQPEELPPVPEEFRVDQAPDPDAFLRAVAKP